MSRPRLALLILVIALTAPSAATAGPWSSPLSLPVVGSAWYPRVVVGSSGVGAVFWREGSDVVAATIGSDGVGARKQWATGSGVSPAAVGATTVPYAGWDDGGAVMVTELPSAPTVLAGVRGSSWFGAGGATAPRSQTYRTRAVAYVEQGANWSLWSVAPDGRSRLTDLGAPGMPLLDVAVAAGRVVAVWLDGSLDAATNRLWVSSGPENGTLGPRVAVTPGDTWIDEAVASVGPEGGATVFWVERPPSVASPLGGWSTSPTGAPRLVDISPTGEIGAPARVPAAPSYADEPSVARGPGGTTTFAFLGVGEPGLAGRPSIVERAASGAATLISPEVPGYSDWRWPLTAPGLWPGRVGGPASRRRGGRQTERGVPRRMPTLPAAASRSSVSRSVAVGPSW